MALIRAGWMAINVHMGCQMADFRIDQCKFAIWVTVDLGDGGCKRLSGFAEFVEEFTGNFIKKVLNKIVEKEQVSLSSELEVIAKDELNAKAEQEILKLAADIIKDGKRDRMIVRVNDIDENIY